MNRTTRAITLLLVTLSIPLAAHDFWIEPTTFEPPVDSVVRVVLRVGPGFDAEPVARNSDAIEAFFVTGPKGRANIIGMDGVSPAGLFRVSAPGTVLMGYRSKPSPLKMTAEPFEKYLKEEGLERIVEARARGGRSGADGVEVFSRSVKSLLLVGNGPREGHDQVLGLTLEIIPERHPAALLADGRMPLRLLYQGAPLEGALVMALSQAGNTPPLHARTDRNGRVVFPLNRGVWMIKAVHMVPAPAGSGADWESIWSSLTFKVSTGSARTAITR